MIKIFSAIFISMSLVVSAQASEKAFNALTKNGFKAEDLVKVVALAPELKDFDITSDTSPIVKKENSHTVIKLYSSKDNETYIVSKHGNNIEVENTGAIFEVEVKSIDGVIQNNLLESITYDIGSTQVAQAVSDAFSDEFTTSKGLRSKPQYRILVEQYYEDGKFVRYGNVLSATLIIGEAMTSKTYRMNVENFSWGLYPEHSGNIERPFYRPVQAERITSAFQLNRRHPVTKKHQPHKGIDFKAPNGAPIFPALEGEVITISRTRSKGKFVTILHDNGYQTTYMHLKNYASGLRVGQWVDLDDSIGEVGRTGYATGAHLHFGVIQEGYFVNPIYLLRKYTYKDRDLHKEDELSVEDKAPISDELTDEETEDAPTDMVE